MSVGVEIRDLRVAYGDTTAVDGASFTVSPGSITGLIGRNGSGKTSVLSVLAAFRRADGGTVLVDGQEPWENDADDARGLPREGCAAAALDHPDAAVAHPPGADPRHSRWARRRLRPGGDRRRRRARRRAADPARRRGGGLRARRGPRSSS